MKTRLTITITVDGEIDRRRLNNLWADSINKTQVVILDENKEMYYSKRSKGIQDYSLEVKIEKD